MGSRESTEEGWTKVTPKRTRGRSRREIRQNERDATVSPTKKPAPKKAKAIKGASAKNRINFTVDTEADVTMTDGEGVSI